jgi:hypothetical protein
MQFNFSLTRFEVPWTCSIQLFKVNNSWSFICFNCPTRHNEIQHLTISPSISISDKLGIKPTSVSSTIDKRISEYANPILSAIERPIADLATPGLEVILRTPYLARKNTFFLQLV